MWYTIAKLNKNYKYSCLMLSFPKEIASKIIDYGKDKIKDNLLVGDGREDDIHVTVLYGLHDEDSDKARESVSKYTGCKLTLGNIDKFETGEDEDVIFVSVDSQDLHSMNKDVRKLPFTNKYDDYHPHVTIAYVKRGSCDHLLGDDIFNGIEVESNDLVFSSFNGSRTNIKLKD